MSASKSAGSPSAVGSYIVLQELGKGTFTQVRLARHTVTGMEVALKIVPKFAPRPDASPQQQAQPPSPPSDAASPQSPNRWVVNMLRRELKVLQSTSHPHLLSLVEAFQSSRNVYLALEYCSGGDLLQFLLAQPLKRLEEPVARRFFEQVIDAVQHMHACGFAHRDLKLENIMLDASHTVKVGDFGFAVPLDQPEFLKMRCGSVHYVAPEVLRDRLTDARTADVWSLGVILFTLCIGKLPFDSRSEKRIFEYIVHGQHFKIPSFVSDELRELIMGMLNVNPSARWTLDQVQTSRWMCPSDAAAPRRPTVRVPIAAAASPAIVAQSPMVGAASPLMPPASPVMLAAAQQSFVASATPAALKHQARNGSMPSPALLAPSIGSASPAGSLPSPSTFAPPMSLGRSSSSSSSRRGASHLLGSPGMAASPSNAPSSMLHLDAPASGMPPSSPSHMLSPHARSSLPPLPRASPASGSGTPSSATRPAKPISVLMAAESSGSPGMDLHAGDGAGDGDDVAMDLSDESGALDDAHSSGATPNLAFAGNTAAHGAGLTKPSAMFAQAMGGGDDDDDDGDLALDDDDDDDAASDVQMQH